MLRENSMRYDARKLGIAGMTLFIMLLSAPLPASGNEPLPKQQIPIELIPIPSGCFKMGDNFGNGCFNEYPVHEVCVKAFHIGKFPVTQGAFKMFVDETSYLTDAEKTDGCYVYDGNSWEKKLDAQWQNTGFQQDIDHPVVCISWHDAVNFTKWFSQKANRNCRLPTEAEWEYAARSGGKIEMYAGSNSAAEVAWHSGNSGGKTHAVGQKNANGFGLYDMSGNVWQWTQDWYAETYYRTSPRNNPQGPTNGLNRVYRGGSWFYDLQGIRTSYRDFFVPAHRSSQLGFRIVCVSD
jgi:formylglycine-generating enzyme required for sulfatase activity